MEARAAPRSPGEPLLSSRVYAAEAVFAERLRVSFVIQMS